MRAAYALCLIGLTVLVPGCALAPTHNNDYEQGFHDGYAACQHENRMQPHRELGPAAHALKIANPPWLAPPIVDEPAKARILGVREPMPTEPPLAIINTVPAQRAPVIIINSSPQERARILGVNALPAEPVRVRINAVTPAP